MSDSQPQHLKTASKKRWPVVLALLFALLLGGGGGFAAYYFLQDGGDEAQSEIGNVARQSASTSRSTSSREAQASTMEPKRVVVGSTESAVEVAKTTAQSEPETPKEEPKQEPKSVSVEPATIDVMMIGDILMHDELVDSGIQEDGSYNFDFLFNNIKEYIDAADMRILNQETVMGDPSRGYHLTMGSVGPVMNTPTEVADSEARFGFNVILKATNHTLDLGYDGLGHEMDYWKATYPDIPVVGVNNPNAAADDSSQDYVNNVYIYEKDGFKIGILNYTWATNDNIDWDTDTSLISYMSEEKIRSDVEKARQAGAEMLIACPHWGIQYDTEPSEEEMVYSKLFCELGVDVIFGCHPHILQRVELLQNSTGHKTVCFYSMGDFVAASIMDEEALIGGIARTTLHREANGTYSITAASLVPTVICHTYGPNMSAFPIATWTDDLTAISARPALTSSYANTFCSNVLGAGFDQASGVYTLNLQGEARTV